MIQSKSMSISTFNGTILTQMVPPHPKANLMQTCGWKHDYVALTGRKQHLNLRFCPSLKHWIKTHSPDNNLHCAHLQWTDSRAEWGHSLNFTRSTTKWHKLQNTYQNKAPSRSMVFFRKQPKLTTCLPKSTSQSRNKPKHWKNEHPSKTRIRHSNQEPIVEPQCDLRSKQKMRPCPHWYLHQTGRRTPLFYSQGTDIHRPFRGSTEIRNPFLQPPDTSAYSQIWKPKLKVSLPNLMHDHNSCQTNDGTPFRVPNHP